MANLSLQLQADNLPIDLVESLLVEDHWEPIVTRLMTGENILLEGSRGVGKTMLMRAASKRLQEKYQSGERVFGVHATFKRYLATLPPPTQETGENPDLENFKAWTNARILAATKDAIRSVKDDAFLDQLKELGSVNWTSVVSILETTYRGDRDVRKLLGELNLSNNVIQSLSGYTFTSDLLKVAINALGVDLLVIFLDDAAHALDTRAQGAFFTSIKSLYDAGLAFKISVYPAVTRYGLDFSYGHDAVVVPLGSPPKQNTMSSFFSLLEKRKGVADEGGGLFDALLRNRPWVELLVFCANANPRALLKLVAQVQTQLAARPPDELRFEDIRLAVNTVMDKHLDNMVPGVIKDLDERLLKTSELLLEDFRQRIAERPGPYEGTKPRAYLAITNSMQVPYICQAGVKLLVAANVVIPEAPARLSKRETGTLYLLHPGFIFRDNVISAHVRGTLSATDWLTFFYGVSSRVHAEIAKSAETWSEIVSEVSSEPRGKCENGHPMLDLKTPCEACGAKAVMLSPVRVLLDKDISVLELSDAIKDRLRNHKFQTVRQLFEATDQEIDDVGYIGEVRTQVIRNTVSAAVDEFVAG